MCLFNNKKFSIFHPKIGLFSDLKIFAQSAKTWKKIQFQMYVWVVARLPQGLKSKFFETFSSLWVSYRDPPLDFFSKNIDFSLWSKLVGLPKIASFWNFNSLFSKKQKRRCETPYFKCNALPIQLDSKWCRWHSFQFLFKFYSQNSLYTFLETIFYKLRFWHYIYFFCIVKWQIHRIYQTNVKLIMIS